VTQVSEVCVPVPLAAERKGCEGKRNLSWPSRRTLPRRVVVPVGMGLENRDPSEPKVIDPSDCDYALPATS
jgi:hypothetical protein